MELLDWCFIYRNLRSVETAFKNTRIICVPNLDSKLLCFINMKLLSCTDVQTAILIHKSKPKVKLSISASAPLHYMCFDPLMAQCQSYQSFGHFYNGSHSTPELPNTPSLLFKSGHFFLCSVSTHKRIEQVFYLLLLLLYKYFQCTF